MNPAIRSFLYAVSPALPTMTVPSVALSWKRLFSVCASPLYMAVKSDRMVDLTESAGVCAEAVAEQKNNSDVMTLFICVDLSRPFTYRRMSSAWCGMSVDPKPMPI